MQITRKNEKVLLYRADEVELIDESSVAEVNDDGNDSLDDATDDETAN